MEEIKPVPRMTVAEVYEHVAAKFGVTMDRILGSPIHGADPLNTPRNVAVVVCYLFGHSQKAVQEFCGRNESVIKGILHRMRDKDKRLKLVWGIWKELGGTWDVYEKVVRPRANAQSPAGLPTVQVYNIPEDEDYQLRGISTVGAGGGAVPAMRYFNEDMQLSLEVCRWLGVDPEKFKGEKLLYANQIRQAVADYLLGDEARNWIAVEESTNEHGISFSDCCTMLSLESSALRRKLAKLEDLTWQSRKSEIPVTQPTSVASAEDYDIWIG